MKLPRLKSIDTFRGLCMTWMILGHLSGWWIRDADFWIANLLSYILDPIGASGFLFIAGISLMLSHRKRLDETKNSEQYTTRMVRNEYFFRALLVLILALFYNTSIAIATIDFRWIWSWFILLTISISFFIAWPLLKLSKFVRLAIGVGIWVGNTILFNILILYENQANLLGVIFYILYNGYHLDPLLTFFPFLLFGTVMGEIIYEIFSNNDPEQRRRIFKKNIFIPSMVIGVSLILFTILFQTSVFWIRRTLPWLFYSMGVILLIFSILLTLEIFGYLEREKSYRLLFYYSYYSLLVYLGHNILYLLFLKQLNLFTIWFFIMGAFIGLGLLLRAIYKKWHEKASIKFRISKLSVRLTNKIENRRILEEKLRKEINV